MFRVILVKHSTPDLDPSIPARKWPLGAEGEAQSRRLADELSPFQPFRLVSSPEPKAVRTAEVVAETLRMSSTVQDGLQEFDRPVLPFMTAAAHAAFNARLFTEPDRRVIGNESAHEALDRFDRALRSAIDGTSEPTLVAVTHGTVISLFTAAHNSVDAFDLWKRLTCPSYVVLRLPRFTLAQTVDCLPET